MEFKQGECPRCAEQLEYLAPIEEQQLNLLIGAVKQCPFCNRIYYSNVCYFCESALDLHEFIYYEDYYQEMEEQWNREHEEELDPFEVISTYEMPSQGLLRYLLHTHLGMESIVPVDRDDQLCTCRCPICTGDPGRDSTFISLFDDHDGYDQESETSIKRNRKEADDNQGDDDDLDFDDGSDTWSIDESRQNIRGYSAFYDYSTDDPESVNSDGYFDDDEYGENDY